MQAIGFSVRMSERTSPDDPYTPAQFAQLFKKHQSWGYRRIYDGTVEVLAGSPELLIPATEVERFSTTTVRHEVSRKPRVRRRQRSKASEREDNQ